MNACRHTWVTFLSKFYFRYGLKNIIQGQSLSQSVLNSNPSVLKESPYSTAQVTASNINIPFSLWCLRRDKNVWKIIPYDWGTITFSSPLSFLMERHYIINNPWKQCPTCQGGTNTFHLCLMVDLKVIKLSILSEWNSSSTSFVGYIG